MNAVTDQLQLDGFTKTENDEELQGKSYYIDRHCPDMLCFSSEQRHFFEEYPLDNFSLIATMFNPIDLSRTLILLKLDISALLGYTGAVFKSFFGTGLGFFVSILMLMIWTVIPILRLVHKSKRKDF